MREETVLMEGKNNGAQREGEEKEREDDEHFASDGKKKEFGRGKRNKAEREYALKEAETYRESACVYGSVSDGCLPWENMKGQWWEWERVGEGRIPCCPLPLPSSPRPSSSIFRFVAVDAPPTQTFRPGDGRPPIRNVTGSAQSVPSPPPPLPLPPPPPPLLPPPSAFALLIVRYTHTQTAHRPIALNLQSYTAALHPSNGSGGQLLLQGLSRKRPLGRG
ncbi:hypothetical protein niasHT_027583 [Heterodera trifolii]|uniref:Uncharacterized protein n=1 Tax=Heterodera trifolii TaxID=157864 RepID=A0ABD2K5E0_9BILA